jgi:type VII secretion integral membrane protein EccD
MRDGYRPLMTAEMCRVSIRSAHRDTDLALPADLPLCELIPTALDVLGEDVCGSDVRLARTDGEILDVARSLAQCGVYDGELLILTAVPDSARQPEFDLCDAVADAVGRTDPGRSAGRLTTAMVAVLWSAAAVAVLLGRTAFDAAAGTAVAGCAAVISALVGAVVLRRDPSLAVTLGGVAAALAGLTAQLAVPALPGFLLAMSAVSATLLFAWRLLDCGTGAFVPLAGLTMATAALMLVEVLGWLSPAGVGPILSTVSLAVLAGAPRLAARLSGLSAWGWPDDVECRAASARRNLSWIVTAAAGASALGTLVTAVLTVRPLEASAFIATVAAILLLRSRTHPDPRRGAALVIGAGIAASAFIGSVAVHAPWASTWLCGVPIAGAAVAIALGRSDLSLSPAADRVTSVVEYAASAAVIPLACATAGFFTAVRSLV